MAVIKAVHTSSVVSGYINDNLSNDLLKFSDNWHPYTNSLINLCNAVSLKRNAIVLDSLKIKGVMPKGYIQDVLYSRMHIFPLEINLGNVVSSQTFNVYVWNAYFTKQNLVNIAGLKDGLTVTGTSAPYAFKPLQELKYEISISSDGEVNIDDYISWQFDNGQTVTVHITGSRAVLFPIMPNWAENGITEKLEWSTDILETLSGMEQRSALYRTPRRYLTADILLNKKERQLFNNMMAWGGKGFVIPIWQNVQQSKQIIVKGDLAITCTTKNMEFLEGGLVLLWQDAFNYELAEILKINDGLLTLKRELTNSWPRLTRIYPAINAELDQQPNLSRVTDQLQFTSISFRASVANPYNSQGPSTVYLDYPVFDLRPNETEDLESQYPRTLITLDNGQAIPLVTDQAKVNRLTQSHVWLGMGRVERAKFRSLLYYLNGRQKAMWLSSYSDDLTIVRDITTTDTAISIENCSYSRFAVNDPDKKHIAIYLKGGEVFYRAITGAVAIGNIEKLDINESLKADIAMSQIRQISFIRLCRLDTDEVEINHITDSEGAASCSLTFKRVRDNDRL